MGLVLTFSTIQAKLLHPLLSSRIANHRTGGPGGSGFKSILEEGKSFNRYFPDGGNYNFIGFDPRGVNNSGPTLTCFPDDTEGRASFNMARFRNVPPNERYQLARANGERCSRVNAQTKAKYVSTSAVAQDLKHFIELNAVAKGQKAEEANFFYFGVSYGTVLGQTLAAMYPDKIERMVLDGNVYGEDWYKGDIRSTVTNSDDAVRSFFAYCAEAGPEKCIFAKGNITAYDLELRYKNILQKLEDEPLVVSGSDRPQPEVVTRSDLSALTFQMTYSPLKAFPMLAQVLSEIDVGNSTAYLQIKEQTLGGAAASEWEGYYSKVPNPDYSLQEALELITCVDVANRAPFTREEYIKLLREFEERSFYAGSQLGTTNALICVGYDIKPPQSQYFPGMRYLPTMPLGQCGLNPNFTLGFNVTKTKSPILFMNNLRDPVTPHIDAVKASKLFPGSVVLALNVTGHGYMGTPSVCASKYFDAYWAKAELPKDGTVCESETKPLVDPYPPVAPAQENQQENK